MKISLRHAKKAIISFLTALAVAASLLVSGGTPAMAGTNGQQITVIDGAYFNKIRIRGTNNYGNPNADTGIVWVSPYYNPVDWQYGYHFEGWYWKGWVLVEVDYNTSNYRSAWCNVPVSKPYNDWHNCFV